MVPMGILREDYWYLPSWKAAVENGLVLGKCCCLGALMGSPRSQMADTWPLATGGVGFEKKGSYGVFERLRILRITGLYPLGKWLWKTGLFQR